MEKINKIFQIGFNKCGTVSVYHFFENNGLKPIHWDMGRLADTIKRNYESNLPILNGYEGYDCFTDMENVNNNNYAHLTYYKEFDIQYPNSKFILNIRPIDNWIKSRLNHPNYLNTNKRILGMNDDEVIQYWKNQWNEHMISVKEYFKGRPNDLLIFDIETETHKLNEFFSKYIEIKKTEFGHHNKTKKLC
jgi:hypothetical protein